MLAALMLGSLGLLVASTALLFTLDPPGAGPARRSTAMLLTLAGSAATAGGLLLLAVPAATAIAVAGCLATVGVAWLPATPHWNARGHLCWTALTVAGPAYLAYMLRWTLQADLGPVGTAGGLTLWMLELAAFVLGLMYGWELIDVLARRRWLRRSPAGFNPDTLRGAADAPDAALGAGDEERIAAHDLDLPFVSLHVPAYNEPPEMVIETLTSLLALDYPTYEILMVDNNTTDPQLWQPVEEFCNEHGITFVHLENWPGFKSGALNWALAHTDPRAEVVGVIDADYLVEPDYLRRCAPLFTVDERLGFVQTPQDYRDWQHAPYFRRLYYSYLYFFVVSQVSRNERDGAIFGGTMGLIRRSALDDLGGWDEWCITEDAELSLRLLRAGWSGQHVERSFGHGIMPLTFEALKRQRFRWCFGGVQILRKHWRSLLPWDRHPDNKLSAKQRYDYLAGGVQWFGDLLGVCFAGLLLLGALSVAFSSGVVFRRLSGALLVVPPALIGLGVLRVLGLIRRRTGASARDAAGALGIWLALGPTVAKACVLGILHSDGVFLRTPKTREGAGWRTAVRANRLEALAGAVLLLLVPVVAVRAETGAALLLAALLGWHAVALIGAPVQSFAALHADLSPQLDERRETEDDRERVGLLTRVGRVGVATAVAAAVATAILFVAAPAGDVPQRLPDVVAEARGSRASSDERDTSGGSDDADSNAPTATTSAGDLGVPEGADGEGDGTATDPDAAEETPAAGTPGGEVVDETPADVVADPDPTETTSPPATTEAPAPGTPTSSTTPTTIPGTAPVAPPVQPPTPSIPGGRP